MGFPFAWVCDHLDDLEKLVVRPVPLLRATLERMINDKTVTWLGNHRARLDASETDADAVILTFQPETMTGRSYGLDALRLKAILARILHLRRANLYELQTWKREPVEGGLSTCLERVLENMNHSRERVVPPSRVNDVTVEEIDSSLLQIASCNSKSSAIIRSIKKDIGFDTIDSLSNIYRRLRFREAKWLTRLILKDFGAVKFPDSLKCSPNAPPLPQCVQVQANFKTSMPEHEILDGPVRVRFGTAANLYNRNLSMSPEATEARSFSTVDVSPCHLLLSSSEESRLNCDMMHHTNQKRHKPQSSAVIQGTTGETASLENCRGRHISWSFRATKNDRAQVMDFDCGHPAKGIIEHGPRLYGTGACRLNKRACALRNCIFVLAPCVAKLQWITKNLLLWHGSLHVTSLKELSQPRPSRRCPQTGKRYRRVVLIEPFNKTQAIEFLKQAECLISEESKGRVEVYDWRILECVAKVDIGQEPAPKSWSKYRMCII